MHDPPEIHSHLQEPPGKKWWIDASRIWNSSFCNRWGTKASVLPSSAQGALWFLLSSPLCSPGAPCFGPTHSHIPRGKWKQLGAASCSTAELLHDLTGTAKRYHKAISRALYSPFPAKKQEVKLNPCQAKLHVYPLFQSNQNDKKLATCYLSNAKNTSCWTRIAAFWMVFCSCQKTS